MYNNLDEQLNAIDDEMVEAVMDGKESVIRELQRKRQEIESLILGNDPV